MPKTIIKSIRLRQDIAELIDHQAGANFTQKFETMVTKAIWEMPQAQKDLQIINKQIEEKKAELRKLSTKTQYLAAKLNQISQNIDQITI